MGKYFKYCCVFFSFLFLLQVTSLKASAEAQTGSNIILLIDNSASMRQTDPNKLCLVAASMLIDTVKQDTNINVIGFGDKVISPHQLADKVPKDNLKAELTDLKFDNAHTDLKDGLKDALNQLSKVQGDKTIIILSDGKEDPAGGLTTEHVSELNSLIDQAHASQVKIHCIGLSQYADAAALGNISFKTGGDYFSCTNTSELFNIFSTVLGNLNNFYTVESYTTDNKQDETINFSSYVDEVIIKIASCENKLPLVEVTQNGKELSTDKAGDAYKIYTISNSGNNSIKISAKDKASNLVIVQMKSKGQLLVDSSQDSFMLPKDVSLDIGLSLKIDRSISGLYMDELDSGVRQTLKKNGDSFELNFKKDKVGQYSILVTAYDGNKDIIAMKNINVNVMDYPSFYYTNPLPKTVMTDKPFTVSLKQLDNTKVDNPSGEIIVDYGDKQEEFPLALNNGVLTTDVTIQRLGNFKITACINGIRANESFSYYLPGTGLQVIQKPYVQIEGDKSKKVFKAGGSLNLKLNVLKNLTYENEKFVVLDSSNRAVGEFEINPGTKGNITVPLKNIKAGKKLVFTLQPADTQLLNIKVQTKIDVLTKFQYYFRWFELPLILIILLAILCGASVWLGNNQYEKYIQPYSLNLEIQYGVFPGKPISTVNLTLDVNNNIQYLNLSKNMIYVNAYQSNTIGYFILNLSHSNDETLAGLNYFLKKEKVFTLEYIPVLDQEIVKDGEGISGSLTYEIGSPMNTEIIIKTKTSTIKVYFQ